VYKWRAHAKDAVYTVHRATKKEGDTSQRFSLLEVIPAQCVRGNEGE
jgi:hypothetical protein